MAKTVLLLIGGRSGEHEISLISGKAVLAAIDRKKFNPLVVVIQKNGEMHLVSEDQIASLDRNPKKVVTPTGRLVSIFPSQVEPSILVDGKKHAFDCAFPLLHGPGGEDGSVQGLFEFCGVPVVGNSVKSSALCMDKGMTKTIVKAAGLPIVPFIEVFRGDDLPKISWPYPIFVKPAHLGSSLGVSKVKKPEELKAAIDLALKDDEKALIEPAIVGREIELGVLGKRSALKVSAVGEIKPNHEFYTYEAKYVDENGAELLAPAPLEHRQVEMVQRLALDVFNAVEGRGMARIDFFLTATGEFFLNEVNTIPGFTPISMYPKLFQLTGMTYPELVTALIESAF